MIETTSIAIALTLMIVSLVVSLIPFIPGPALLWGIGLVFAILNDFERVTIPAVVIMTILMVIGSTNEIWLRYLGMRSRGGSCWGTIGSIIGGILGTGLIPIPILGTLIGAIVGALLVEFMRIGEIQQAVDAGRSVLEMYVVGIVVEFGISLGIFAVFAASLYLTR